MSADGGGMRARDLRAWYGKDEILHAVSLDLPPRAVTAIIGPSGCGKSTFVRCLNRLHEEIPGARAAGVVTLNGADVYSASLPAMVVRRRIGMVFQRPNVLPTRSIFDNVALGLRLNGIGRRHDLPRRVEHSLRRAALWDEVKDRLRDNAQSLSGGQQQRLCIARALAVEPEVLLMDEPTSALDPLATQRIEDLMSTLKNELTLVIVTHNMQQAARVADRTVFFLLGRLIEEGPTGQLFSRPREQQTEDYITGRFG